MIELCEFTRETPGDITEPNPRTPPGIPQATKQPSAA
jgi:hypothetical protein